MGNITEEQIRDAAEANCAVFGVEFEYFAKGAQWAMSHDQWVEVSERFPEKGDDYNIVIDLQDGMGGPVSGSGEFDGIKKVFCYQGTEIQIDNVTHWSEIPQPPKKGADHE